MPPQSVECAKKTRLQKYGSLKVGEGAELAAQKAAT